MKIKIENLNKVYGNGNHAIKGLNLEIENGMFGLLGPNGAGKSSLMRILVTLMKPSSGIIKVNELDIIKDRKEIRSMLGYLPQRLSLFLIAFNLGIPRLCCPFSRHEIGQRAKGRS